MRKRSMVLVSVGLAVLLLMGVAATSAFAQGPAPYGQQGTPGWRGGMMGSGMMGGYGQGYGCGMMGGGMMGSWGVPANANPISMDQAVTAAQQYVAAYNNDLALSEIMEFANNFYVQVKEKSTGKGAFELLVNRYNGGTSPEMGPNMMWNSKYGAMAQGGMMGMMGGRWGGQQAGVMTVTEQQARANAQQWLDSNFSGAKLADDIASFYGYYTLDFLQNGKPAGMLSVNGYTGQVWYHTWHGAFVAEKEL